MLEKERLFVYLYYNPKEIFTTNPKEYGAFLLERYSPVSKSKKYSCRFTLRTACKKQAPIYMQGLVGNNITTTLELSMVV